MGDRAVARWTSEQRRERRLTTLQEAVIGPSVAGSSEGVTSDPKRTPVWTRADISRAFPAEIPATIEALCRTRTGDPFLTMEVLYQLS